MTDENKPLNYRTLSELYAAYNSGLLITAPWRLARFAASAQKPTLSRNTTATKSSAATALAAPRASPEIQSLVRSRHGTAAQPAAQAQEDAKDAARWCWIANYLIGNDTSKDDGIVACTTVEQLEMLVDTEIAAT